MIRYLLLCLLFSFGINMGCKSGHKKEPGNSNAAATIPFLSSQEINMLYKQTEQVDIIFYDLPISVTQDDAASARHSVLYIIPSAPAVQMECKAVARLAWIAAGTIIREADVHMAEGCSYLRFIHNNQPVALNSLSTEGVQFFTHVMSQKPQLPQ